MTRRTYIGAVTALLAAVGVAGLVIVVMATAGASNAQAQTANTITVDTPSDTQDDTDGKCSLREAIINANSDDQSGSTNCAAGSGADTMVFALEQSEIITLGSTLPIVTDTDGLTIDGGSASITVSGDNAVRVLRIAQNAKLTLQNLTVAKGSAADTGVNSGTLGGGVFNDRGTLTVIGSTFSENSADLQGGAIYAGGTAPLTVTDSTFFNNKAASHGGAIRGSNPLTVTGSTFSENSAGTSGGAILTSSIGSPSTVTNSTFWKNSAENFFGGGIRNSGLLTVKNSTFSENSASEDDVAGGFTGGGAIANLPSGSQSTPTSTTLHSTILTASQGGNCQNAANSGGTFTDGGYNIEDSTSCGFSQANNSKPYTDARLDPNGLSDNGGPTKTIALQKNSPAIDQGKAFESTTDQRGVGRPQDDPAIQNAPGGDGSDIGAFELKNNPPVANKDSYTIEEGERSLTVPAATGVLANDSDPEEDTLTATLLRAPKVGTLKLREDGSFTYKMPKKMFKRNEFSGVAFVYEIKDEAGNTDRVKVTINKG